MRLPHGSGSRTAEEPEPTACRPAGRARDRCGPWSFPHIGGQNIESEPRFHVFTRFRGSTCRLTAESRHIHPFLGPKTSTRSRNPTSAPFRAPGRVNGGHGSGLRRLEASRPDSRRAPFLSDGSTRYTRSSHRFGRSAFSARPPASPACNAGSPARAHSNPRAPDLRGRTKCPGSVDRPAFERARRGARSSQRAWQGHSAPSADMPEVARGNPL